MGDKGAMFCASCGTVSMAEGNCPQCAKPLRKLGRVGAITESNKRVTQRMISQSNIHLDLQGVKRTPLSDSDSSSSAFLTLYRPSSPTSPSRGDKQDSPRQSPRTLAAPVLASTRILAQSQTMPPATSIAATQEEETPPTAATQPSDDIASHERKSYLNAAISRVSQVFSWRTKSTEQKPPEQQSSPTLVNSFSSPDFSTLSLPHAATSGGVRVLPPNHSHRISRRRSSIDIGSRTQSSSFISNIPTITKRKDDTLSKKHASTISASLTSNSPVLSSSTSSASSSSSARSSSAPTSPASPSPSFSSPSLSRSPASPISPSVTSSVSVQPSSPTRNQSIGKSPALPRRPPPPTSLDIPANGAESSSINSPRPTKAKPNLKIVVGDEKDDIDSENSTKLFKNKSTLNISYGVASHSLHTLQKSRALPALPIDLNRTNSDTSSNSGTSPSGFGTSPPLVSPRHPPPNRPLPATPTSKSDAHPIMMRRNTVHSEMNVVIPDSKESPSDWVLVASQQKLLSPPKQEVVGSPSTPKGEVTLLPPSPKRDFYHSHIPPPPYGLASDEMREKIALELITTEYEYVNDLYTLVSAKNEMEHFIHKNELSSVFNNVDQIYKINEIIYKKMLGYCANGHRRPENSVSEDSTPSADDKVAAISRTFLGLAHTMKIYVKYSLGHQRALEKLQLLMETEEYGELLKGIEAMPGFKGSAISVFLIKPVQRICRYPLLIKEIVKSTPTGHHTQTELQEALECIEQTLVEINEAQRSIERELNLMRAQQDLRLFGMDIDVMSPTRTLVLDGPMRLVPVLRKTVGGKVIKKPKQGHYFLFDDFFLFVMNTKKKETPHIFIPADQSLVTDPGDNALEIIHAGQQIWMFVLPSYHDKVFLMQKLNQIIEDNLQEARQRNGGQDKSGKSTLNIATLTRTGKNKKKKKGMRELNDMFAEK